MSTLKTTNLQNASAANPAFVLAADGSATANLSSLNGGALAGMRNRIINGDMRIDQRNAGASVTPSNQYVLDRWHYGNSQASKGTIQQNAGAVTPPSGFDNYLGFTSSSAYSVLSTDEFFIRQPIEGFNFSDFAFGTASAKSCTISFWVRSSLTGTFGAVLKNSGSNRSYPFTYAISTANTWEYKTQTIAGDTTGTWVGGTNGIGAYLVLALGAGSTRSGTAGAWAGVDAASATGATSVVGTNGATFYITGVQLEPGTVATPFERRSYGQELALCQRYFQPIGTGFTGRCSSSSGVEFSVGYRVQMRANATVSLGGFSGATTQFDCFGTAGTQTIAGSFSSPVSWSTGAYFSLGVSGTPLTTGALAFLIRGDVASANAEL
jgi:hypothetical protein